MKKYLALLFIALLGSGLLAFAQSDSAAQHKIYDATKLSWGDAPPGFPAGAKIAVLDGNPTTKGLFTVRLQVPDGYKIPAHTHPTAENITVISGTFYLGTGEKLDVKAGQKMNAGDFTSLPAGMQHFAWAKGSTVVQVHGEGPFEITYVNPSEDPRNAKK